ncbi:MAG: dTDP-glucose 4,6-dehydratase [Candidatus Omnitrophica bacterium]|nr:dTDP-glucose 4,6-dehydratase [Candidatus Omnitrophota bacterium]
MHKRILKILITGGAGFIGSNFIRHLLEEYSQYRIINLDKLTYAGNLDNLKDLEKNPNYEFIKGDICDSGLLEKVMAPCDIVINFAAQTHVDRSILSSKDFLKTNVYGVNQLLETALKYKLKRVIQISTDEVYGSRLKGSSKESDLLNPSNPYSASKAAADLLAISYFKTYNLPVIITRSSNNFGPYQYPEKVVPLFITNVLQNKPLPLYGRGLNVRDWIFVEDNCRAIDLVMHKGKSGEIYNIASGFEKRNKDLATIILKLMRKPTTLIRYVLDRPGHDLRYALDCAKIKDLGWQPKYNFLQGLELTIKWYLRNTVWWQRVKEKKDYRLHYKDWYKKRRLC